jgi:hypothetical protein
VEREISEGIRIRIRIHRESVSSPEGQQGVCFFTIYTVLTRTPLENPPVLLYFSPPLWSFWEYSSCTVSSLIFVGAG